MARTSTFSACVSPTFTARRHLPQSRQAVRSLRNLQARTCRFISPTTKEFWSISFKAFEGPIIEVHISNIHARDELHRHSKLSSAAKAVICGLGPYGYIVAMQAALHMLGKLPASLPTPIRVGPR